MTFFGIYSAEKFGRRWPLIIGGLWQTAWLLIFASVGTAIDPEDSSSSGIVMIISACMFIASFAVSWGPLGWVVVGEIFPLRTRAKQAALATASNWLANCKYSSIIFGSDILMSDSPHQLSNPICRCRYILRFRLCLRWYEPDWYIDHLLLPLRVQDP